MTKSLLTLLIAAFATALLAADAVGQSASSPGETPMVSGRLEVDGRGTAVLNGRLVVFGMLGAPTYLTVVDNAGDGRLTVNGERVLLRRGKPRRVKRAEGRVYIAGQRVAVGLRGRDMTLSVAGRGRAILRGHGVFRLNDGPSYAWDGKPVPILPSIPPDLGRADGNEPRPAQRAPRRVFAAPTPSTT